LEIAKGARHQGLATCTYKVGKCNKTDILMWSCGQAWDLRQKSLVRNVS